MDNKDLYFTGFLQCSDERAGLKIQKNVYRKNETILL